MTFIYCRNFAQYLFNPFLIYSLDFQHIFSFFLNSNISITYVFYKFTDFYINEPSIHIKHSTLICALLEWLRNS